jgi:hypothetical protein
MNLPDLRDATEGVQEAHAAILRDLEGIDALPKDATGLGGLYLRDVLVAYLILARGLQRTATQSTSDEPPVSPAYHNLRLITARYFITWASEMSSVHLIVELATGYPDDALTLCDAVSLIKSKLFWPAQAANDTILGELTREIYDAAGFDRLLSRSAYLERRLRATRSMDAAHRNLALTLARDWAGTLDELKDTAKTLHSAPQVPA